MTSASAIRTSIPSATGTSRSRELSTQALSHARTLLEKVSVYESRVLYHTVWTEGMRVVNDVSGTPIRPEWVRMGQLVNAEPEIFYNGEPYGEETIDGELSPGEASRTVSG